MNQITLPAPLCEMIGVMEEDAKDAAEIICQILWPKKDFREDTRILTLETTGDVRLFNEIKFKKGITNIKGILIYANKKQEVGMFYVIDTNRVNYIFKV